MRTKRPGRSIRAAVCAAAIVAASVSRGVRAADEAPLAPTAVWECGCSPRGLAVSGDGKLVVALRFLGPPVVLDAANGKKLRQIDASEGRCQVIAFVGGERAILVAAGSGADGPPLLFDSGTGTERGHLARKPGSALDVGDVPYAEVAVPRDGRTVFARWQNNSNVSFHDAESGALSSELRVGYGSNVDPGATRFERMACSNDGRTLSVMVSIRGDRIALQTYRVYPDGKYFVLLHDRYLEKVGGESPNARAWLTDEGAVFVTEGAPPADAPIRSPCALFAWRTDTGAQLWSSPLAELADVNTCGSLLARTTEHAVEVLEVATGRTVHRLGSGENWKPVAVAFAPGAARLFVGSNDGKLAVFDLPPVAPAEVPKPPPASGATTDVVVRPGSKVSCLAAAPDDSLLVVGCTDGKVRVVDAVTRKESRVLAGHKSAIRSVAFLGGDPAWLASISADRLRVWNPGTGYLRKDIALQKPDAHGRPPDFAASPKGHLLVYRSESGKAIVWDGDGAERTWNDLRFYEPGVFAFSPDGTSIALVDVAGADEPALSGTLSGYGLFETKTGNPVWVRHPRYAALVSEDEEDVARIWVAARFTPNGDRLIRLLNDRLESGAGEMGGRIRSSASATGAPQWKRTLPGIGLRDLVFRSDGRALLLTERGPYDLDTRTGDAEPAADLPSTIVCAAFAPKSGLLYLALSDGSIVSAKRPR